MKQFFIIVAITLALGSSIQANVNENSEFAAPTHVQRLKKLMYVLSEPKFDFKGNAKDKDLDIILDYIGDLRFMSPDAQLRAARQLSDVIKSFAKKIKDVVTKITEPFEQLSSKIKDFFANIFKPIRKLLGKTADNVPSPEEKKE